METNSRLIGGRLGRSSDIAGQPTAADISLAQQMVRGQDEQVLGVFRPTQSEAAKALASALPSSRPGTPIAFERSLTNLGGGWGRDGATFTTPASGVYRYLNMLNMLQ